VVLDERPVRRVQRRAAAAYVFNDLVSVGAQIVCATHSPLLTALPGATIYELDGSGLRQARWADLASSITGAATSRTRTAT
jgi:predicted ATPase